MGNRIEEINEQILKLREELASRIMKIPDNDGIERLGEHAFTLKSSSLGNHWDVFYHDFEAQKKLLLEVVIGSPFGYLKRNVQSVCEKGKWRIEGRVRTFHPVVVQHLEEIFEEVING